MPLCFVCLPLRFSSYALDKSAQETVVLDTVVHLNKVNLFTKTKMNRASVECQEVCEAAGIQKCH